MPRSTATKGASGLGYALLLGLIGIVALIAMQDIGNNMRAAFGGVGDDLQRASDGLPLPSPAASASSSPEDIALASSWADDQVYGLNTDESATATITVTGMTIARDASVIAGSALINGSAGPVTITPDGSGNASFSVEVIAASTPDTSETVTIDLSGITLTLTTHTLPASFSDCNAVRNAPGNLANGIYTITEPNQSVSGTYDTFCEVEDSFVSCTHAANNGASTDGYYLINGAYSDCRFGIDGKNWKACMFRQTDQRDDFFCGGISATDWMISDETGRIFIATASSGSMTWPSSGGESVFNASWRQIAPEVSPSISGSTFCLSSRTYYGSGGYANHGKFAFANSGSANSGSYQGCVTALDGGQYFGGHSVGVGESIYQAGSWTAINNAPGVLVGVSFYLPN